MVGAEGSLIKMIQLYSGSGWLMLAFAAALLFLWVTEKDKGHKSILIYLSILTVALFFFPLTRYVMMDVMGEEETYYRILWWLPFGIVLPYAVIRFMQLLKKKWMQAAFFILASLILCWGGTLVYRNAVFSKTENVYQVPNSVKEICDLIVVEGREVMAVFPDELIPYVRQYTSNVVMPYGYANIVVRWNLTDDLREIVTKEQIDTASLVIKLRERGCHYFVVANGKSMTKRLEEYDYTCIANVDGYDVYLDNTAYLGLWDE